MSTPTPYQYRNEPNRINSLNPSYSTEDDHEVLVLVTDVHTSLNRKLR